MPHSPNTYPNYTFKVLEEEAPTPGMCVRRNAAAPCLSEKRLPEPMVSAGGRVLGGRDRQMMRGEHIGSAEAEGRAEAEPIYPTFSHAFSLENVSVTEKFIRPRSMHHEVRFLSGVAVSTFSCQSDMYRQQPMLRNA
jgi:hypothetical protein